MNEPSPKFQNHRRWPPPEGYADPAGDNAVAKLLDRARAAGIEALVLSPRLGDFNEDLCALGLVELRAALRVQLVPEDVARFMKSPKT
jgi:hypothetical protein